MKFVVCFSSNCQRKIHKYRDDHLIISFSNVSDGQLLDVIPPLLQEIHLKKQEEFIGGF